MNPTKSTTQIIDLNPTEWEQLREEEVPRHRNLPCSYYPVCLSFAAICRWTGFSCRNCQEWKEKKR